MVALGRLGHRLCVFVERGRKGRWEREREREREREIIHWGHTGTAIPEDLERVQGWNNIPLLYTALQRGLHLYKQGNQENRSNAGHVDEQQRSTKKL